MHWVSLYYKNNVFNLCALSVQQMHTFHLQIRTVSWIFWNSLNFRHFQSFINLFGHRFVCFNSSERLVFWHTELIYYFIMKNRMSATIQNSCAFRIVLKRRKKSVFCLHSNNRIRIDSCRPSLRASQHISFIISQAAICYLCFGNSINIVHNVPTITTRTAKNNQPLHSIPFHSSLTDSPFTRGIFGCFELFLF